MRPARKPRRGGAARLLAVHVHARDHDLAYAGYVGTCRLPCTRHVAGRDRLDDLRVLGDRPAAGRPASRAPIPRLGEIRVEVGEEVVEQAVAARLGDRDVEVDVEQDQLVGAIASRDGRCRRLVRARDARRSLAGSSAPAADWAASSSSAPRTRGARAPRRGGSWSQRAIGSPSPERRSLTNAPRPCWTRTRPIASSERIASRTLTRLTPNVSTSSRSDGSRSPGPKSPRLIASSIWRAPARFAAS